MSYIGRGVLSSECKKRQGGARLHYVLVVLLVSFFSSCAVVGVNKYQNAETLGKGEVRAGGSVGLGRNLDAAINVHEGNINTRQYQLAWEDYIFPVIEFSYQYGITPTTDAGIVSGVFPGYIGVNVKQELFHSPEDFAIAIMPESVFFSHSYSSTLVRPSSGVRNVTRERYQGYSLSFPLILSKRWGAFSVFISPQYTYQHLKITADYQSHYTSMASIEKLSNAVLYSSAASRSSAFQKEFFDLRSLGLVTGISLDLGNVQVVPVVTHMRIEHLYDDSFDWVFFPGLGIYAGSR